MTRRPKKKKKDFEEDAIFTSTTLLGSLSLSHKGGGEEIFV